MSKLFRAAAVVAALFAMAGLVAAEDKKDDKKKAGAAAVSGKVKSVDATGNKITLEGKKKKDAPGEDQTYDVAKDAKVTISGEAKTLADVKAGDQATLALSEDKKTATAITIGKKKK